MSAEARWVQRGPGAEIGEHAGQVVDGDAEAAHPGVHLDVDLGSSTAARGGGREALEIGRVVDDGREAGGEDVCLMHIVVSA
jgi:hypothetical protein